MTEHVCAECEHPKDEHDMTGSRECGVGWEDDGFASVPGEVACECIEFGEVSR